MTRALDVDCTACEAQPGEECCRSQACCNAELVGRFHAERVVAAGMATREANARARAASLPIAKITEQCPAHPGEFAANDDGTHECLADEMRCAYCGVRLAPYPCHSCGKFLTARRMHAAAAGEIPHHCEDCTP